MLPFVNIGKLSLPSYVLMAAASAMISSLVFTKLARSRGWKRKRLFVYLALVFLSLFVGAKLYNVFIDHAGKDVLFPLFLVLPSGFSLYGALIAGIAATALFSRIARESVPAVLDMFSLSASFGFALGRVGCLLSGCCYGKPTLFGVALEFSDFNAVARPIGVPLHATQVYEIILFLFIGLVATILFIRFRNAHGLLTAVFFIVYPASRFFLEYLRGNPRRCLHGLSIGQWASMLLFAGGLLMLLHVMKSAGAFRISRRMAGKKE
jgi:phosphatidylglycerol:prolipoprotein diacylglycerol transferase